MKEKVEEAIKSIEALMKESFETLEHFKSDFSTDSVNSILDEVLDMEDSAEFECGYIMGLKNALSVLNELKRRI